MYLGVVARPIAAENFDGKIFLDRVAQTTEYLKTTNTQRFSNHAGVNWLLRRGRWIELLTDDMSLGEFKESIADNPNYNLDKDIVERLVFRYRTGVSKDGKPKWKYITDDDEYLWNKDCMRSFNCDSDYMKSVMPKVEKVRTQNLLNVTSPARLIVASFFQAIREAYHFVDTATPIFLYLDNAGGHGTDNCVTEYVKMLEEDYNVICIHQRPRSPATNMLDLGVWMAFQNVVEKIHAGKVRERDTLARTVKEAWRKMEPVKLTNVWHCWRLVLDLIIEDNGGNRKVESKRGKLFRAPPDHDKCINEEVRADATPTDAVEEQDLDAEPGFDKEFAAALEAEARTPGGWAC